MRVPDAPDQAPQAPQVDPAYLAMAEAAITAERQREVLKGDQVAMADDPAAKGKPMFEVGGGRGGGVSFGKPVPVRQPANTNTSQKDIKEMLPSPLSRSERDWQNYGRHMKPDDVLDSEVVWGRAALYRDQGLAAEEGFASAANDFWGRMGANRFITPEQAKKYMHKGKTNLKMVE